MDDFWKYLIFAVLAVGPITVLVGVITLILKRRDKRTSLVRICAVLAILAGLLFSAFLGYVVYGLLKGQGSFGR